MYDKFVERNEVGGLTFHGGYLPSDLFTINKSVEAPNPNQILNSLSRRKEILSSFSGFTVNVTFKSSAGMSTFAKDRSTGYGPMHTPKGKNTQMRGMLSNGAMTMSTPLTTCIT